MEALVFGKGMILGFLLCAPLGPIGILCVQRTIVSGRLAGALSVLGAAVVDALYALAAAFGLTLVAAVVDQSKQVIQPMVGVILAVVGIRLFFEPAPASEPPADRVKHLRDAFLTTFLLMLSNPLPVIVISAALSTLIGQGVGGFGIPLLVAGVFTGSALWAPILVFCISLVTPLLNGRHLRFFQRICGVAIFSCGLAVGSAPFVSSLQ